MVGDGSGPPLQVRAAGLRGEQVSIAVAGRLAGRDGVHHLTGRIQVPVVLSYGSKGQAIDTLVIPGHSERFRIGKRRFVTALSTAFLVGF